MYNSVEKTHFLIEQLSPYNEKYEYHTRKKAPSFCRLQLLYCADKYGNTLTLDFSYLRSQHNIAKNNLLGKKLHIDTSRITNLGI